MLSCPPERDQIVELGSLWANVEGRVGVVGLYGDDQLVVHQSTQRRGGKYGSLYVDEICLGCALGTRAVDPDSVILDAGWAVLSGVDADRTRAFAQDCAVLDLERAGVRGVFVRGLDGVSYTVLANFGSQDEVCPAAPLLGSRTSARDLAAQETFGREDVISVAPGRVRVLALNARFQAEGGAA